MKVIDTNILLYARDSLSAQHKTILAWWEQAIGGDEPIALPWVAVLGFLRMSTNGRVFKNPLSASDSVQCIEQWLSCANVRLICETAQHWRILTELLTECGTAGNLTTDAHIAALAIGRGATLVSCDTDFARFKRLRWENPLAAI